MTEPIQTLDSALQAIAAEREALKVGLAGSLAELPSSTVPQSMPSLPPIPRSPGLVNNLPVHLQSVTRLDEAPVSPHGMPVAPAESSGGSKALLIAANIALSLLSGVGTFYFMSFISGGSNNSETFQALAKSDYDTAGKQSRITSVDSARMNKSCTIIFQDGAGRTKSSACVPSSVVAGTEVVQYSSASTSATINPNKFNESLSSSNSKIVGSLSESESSDSLISPFGTVYTGGYEANGSEDNAGLESGETALKLKPRGIVKRFYTKN